MAFLFRRLAGMAARRILFDPRMRQNVVNAARGAATEARNIARDKDPYRAAGRSVRGAYERVRKTRDEPEDGQER